MKPAGVGQEIRSPANVTDKRGGFGVGVDVFDQLAVALFDGAAADFHGVGQGAVGGGKFVRHEDDFLQLFKAGEVAINVLDDALVKCLHLGMRDQFGPRLEGDLIVPRPIFQQGEVRRDQDGRELALVADDDGLGDQCIVLQGVLDGLGSNKFSARSLDQIFLAVGDGQKSVSIEIADVPGLEPAIDESVGVSSGRFQ